MKILLAFMGLVFLFSCKKSKDNNDLPELNGKWELRRIEYDYSVQPEIKYAANNGNVISFSGNDKYIRTDITIDDTVATSGNYRISHSITCSSQTVSVIDFSGGYSGSSLLIVAGDSLYFKSDSCVVADGVKRTYVKTN